MADPKNACLRRRGQVGGNRHGFRQTLLMGVVVFALAILAWTPGAQAALTRTYLAKASSTYNASTSVSSLNVSAGDMIVVTATSFTFVASTETFSISSANMGTLSWTQITQLRANTGTKTTRTSIFYAIVQATTASGSVTVSTSTDWAARFVEVHKISSSTSSTIEVQGSGTVSSQVSSGGTISLTLNATPLTGDIQLAIVGHHDWNDPVAGRFTSGSSFTEQSDDKPGGQFYAGTQHRTNSTSTAVSWTLASATGAEGEAAVGINVREVASANRYWIGSSGDSFSDATKWSTTAGGSNNAGVPGASEVAHFTTGTGALLSGTIAVKGMTFASGFTGTVADSPSQSGLRGKYYTGTNYNTYKGEWVDTTINWVGSSAFDPTLVTRTGQGDNVSVRWEGEVLADNTGTYTFYARTDDGTRLWVNNVLLVDKWVNQAATEWSGTISLTAGQWYSIKMEYYEATGGAEASLSYQGPSITKQIIPSTKLRTSTTASVTIGSDGFSLAGGTFVAPSSMTVNGPFTRTGGTFTHNSGTVVLAVSSSLGGGTTFYNLTIDGGSGSGGSEPTPVTRWRFDEGTGTTTADSVGSNTGTLTNGPSWSTDKPTAILFTNPYSLSFSSASSQYVATSALAGTLGGTASMSFWIKTTQVGNNTQWQAPAVTGSESSLGGDVFWGFIDGSGRIGLQVEDAAAAKSTAAINNGQWHHVALTRNKTSGELKVYINGSLNSTATSATGDKTSPFAAIGRMTDNNSGGTHRYFNGLLDDVRIYNTVLSATDVTALYAAASETSPAVITLNGNVTVTNTLTIAATNELNLGTHTLSIGSLTNNGTLTPGTGTILFTGSGGALPALAYHNLTINNASATWTLGAALTITGGVTITAGTLDVTASNHALNIAGGFTNSGTFNARSGTVTFTGTSGSHVINPGASSFYRLTLNGAGGSWALGANVTVANLLTLTAGTLDVGTRTLSNTHSAAATISGATLLVGTGTASLTSGLTMSAGTLSLTSTGTLALGNGSTTTISGGTFTSSAGSIANMARIGASGNYGFSMTGGTIDIDGMLIRHTDLNGINIGNGVTITRIANTEFSGGITTTGSKYLTITKNALSMFMEGLKFDTATTYNVHLVGNGDGDGATRLTVQNMNASTNGDGAGEARDLDDDSAGNGISSNPSTNGAVVQWVTYYTDVTGASVIGFPTPAFDWNTFQFYGTYVAIKDANGTADRIYVRGGDGASQGFSWDGPSGEDFIGAPRWIQEGTDRIVFVITTGKKVYKLRNTGSALEVVANWPYTSVYTPTTSVGIGNSFLVWAANGSGNDRYLQRLDHTAANPNTAGPANYQYSSSGTKVDAMTANPALAVISNTLYAFFAAKSRVYRLDATSWSAVVDSTAAPPTQPNGRLGVFFSRLYFGDDEGRLFVKDAANSTLPTLWSYQGTAPGGGACAVATCKFENLTVGFNLPDTATYPRAYWGDASGRLYAVRQNGTGGTLIDGFPLQLATGTGSIITAAPLYFTGVIVVGNQAGDLFVVNQRTVSGGTPAIVQRYNVGGPISSVSRDNQNARYIAVAGGRLFYYPVYTDQDGFR